MDMSNLDREAHAGAVKDYAAALRRVRRNAGDIPIRTLARIADYSTATVTRALHGEALPKWEFTREYLRACGIQDEQTILRWRQWWVEIKELRDPMPAGMPASVPAADPVPPAINSQQPPAGYECPACGSWVTNHAKHQEWHHFLMRTATAAAMRGPA